MVKSKGNFTVCIIYAMNKSLKLWQKSYFHVVAAGLWEKNATLNTEHCVAPNKFLKLKANA